MIGEGGSYFGKDDLFFLLRNCHPNRVIARSAFLFFLEARRSVHRRTYTYNIKSRLAALFGGVADRESKHLGKKASGI